MKAHKGLSRRDVLRRGPARVALMAASEFSRAASRKHDQKNVLACFRRARELLGILETAPLPEAAARRLRPLYRLACESSLLSDRRLDPRWLSRFGLEMADELERAFR